MCSIYYAITQKTMSPRKSKEDVMIKFCKSKEGEKQLFADVLHITSSKKFCKFHRKIPVLESLFKVTDLGFKKRLQHRCFPVKLAKILRTTFLQNTSCGCFLQGSVKELA